MKCTLIEGGTCKLRGVAGGLVDGGGRGAVRGGGGGAGAAGRVLHSPTSQLNLKVLVTETKEITEHTP
jgi:hypothetical protein